MLMRESGPTREELLEKAKMLDSDSGPLNGSNSNYTSNMYYNQNNTNQHTLKTTTPVTQSVAEPSDDYSPNVGYVQSTPSRGKAHMVQAESLDGGTVKGGSSKSEKHLNEELKQTINELHLELRRKDNIISSLNVELGKIIASNNEHVQKLDINQRDIEAFEIVSKEKDLELNELKQTLQNSEAGNTQLTKQISEATELQEQFSSFISKLSLFDIPLGNIINSEFNSIESDSSSKSIIEILTDHGVDIFKKLRELNKDITGPVDVTLNELRDQTELLTLDDKTHFEKTMNKLTAIEKKVIETGIPVQELLIEFRDNFNEQIKNSEEKLSKQNNAIEQFKTDFIKLENQNSEKNKIYDELVQRFSRSQGNDADKLKFEDVMCPDISKDVFDSLELEAIEDLNMIELQNSLKHVCLSFQIPFDKLQRKMILANVLIKSELVIALDFINLLYFEVFKSNLEFESYSEEAYLQYRKSLNIDSIRHPLNPILNELLNQILEIMNYSD